MLELRFIGLREGVVWRAWCDIMALLTMWKEGEGADGLVIG